MLANVGTSGREVLIVVRAYLDSSGKPHERRVTLAAFCACDEAWNMMEYAWRDVLLGHPLKPNYIHMKELCHLQKEFSKQKGWTLSEAFGLVNKMLMFLQMFPKKDFNMFYCSIDLEARRKLIKEGYKIPDPVSLCNGFCSEIIIRHYLREAVEKDSEARYENLDGLNFYFDQGEEYFGPFQKKWLEMTKRARRDEIPNPWVSVVQVTTANMRRVPGLQMADVLAWAVNRGHMAEEGKPGKHHAHIMKQILAGYRVEMDEAEMRKRYPKQEAI
jgi:hypothetical protein